MRRHLLVVVLVALASAACAGSDGATTTSSPPAPTSTTSTTPAPATTLGPVTTTGRPPETGLVTDGVTVTDDIIHLGVLADLSGPFSSNVIDVVDAQLAFWADLNDRGGVAGRRIELHIADTGYDLARHQQSYAELVDRVVMFSHSTGSPHTAAIADDLVRDRRLAIPVGWYSGWSDPGLGANLLELGSNYCLEAVNAVSQLDASHREQFDAPPRLAIATDAGDYGQDSAAGAKRAAEALGIEVVYDGEAMLAYGSGADEIAAAIAASGADYTWLATDPLTTAEVVSKALIGGYRGGWSGASPSFSPRLLDSALGDYLSHAWLASVFFAPLGADVEGMDAVYAVLRDALPDRYPSDALIAGYLQFALTVQVLERAVELGDLTPEGLVAASKELGEADFAGVSPASTYDGPMDSVVVRATALYRPGKTRFDAQGGLAARLSEGAVSPFEPTDGWSTSAVAAELDLDRPCWVFGED